MSDSWEAQDRPCPPCPECGVELYEKFYGGGGWVKTEKTSLGDIDVAHHDRRCRKRLADSLRQCRTMFDVTRHRICDALGVEHGKSWSVLEGLIVELRGK